jgi:hypothetical protein
MTMYRLRYLLFHFFVNHALHNVREDKILLKTPTVENVIVTLPNGCAKVIEVDMTVPAHLIKHFINIAQEMEINDLIILHFDEAGIFPVKEFEQGGGALPASFLPRPSLRTSS